MNHSSWARLQTGLQFLRRYFAPTRLPCASSLGRGRDTQVYLKLESELPTGSFKLRGALYALNAEMGRRRVPEVVAPSTGNHGAAVAYAGKILNPSYYLSWKRGVVVTTKSCDTIADGLATGIPIQENVTAIRALVDDVNLVTEAQLLSAVEHLYISEQIVAEPAGAATTAAWLAVSQHRPDAPVVLLVTGSNSSM
jgi:threonine dehydratase